MVDSNGGAFARAVAVKERVEAELLAKPGVCGVDVGYKTVSGTRTADVAIRVYVDSKGVIPDDDPIPEFIDGIRTDVIERRILLH